MRQLIRALTFVFSFCFILNAQDKKIDSLKTIINSSQHDTLKAMAMSDLAKIYLKNKDTISYKENEARLEKLFTSSKFPKVGSLYFLVKASFIERFRNDQEKVLEFFTRSYEYCLKANDKSTAGKRLGKIAGLMVDLGMYKESIESYYKTIELCEEIGNDVGISYAYFGLGEVFRLQKNSKKALEVYYNAYKISQKTQDPSGLSASFNNIGMMYNESQNTDSALKYYNLGLEFNTKRNREDEVANTLDRIATVYMFKGDYKEAIKMLERSLAIKIKYDDISILSITYINLAEACNGLGNDKEALKFLEKGMDIALKKQMMDQLEYCYKFAGILYKNVGNYEKCILSYEKYMQLHDSLITVVNSRTASEMEGKYQNEKKQKEIELLNKDKALQDVDIKKQKQFNLFIVIVAIMLALTVFFIFRGLRQKQKDNKALEEKNHIINEQKTIVEEKNREILDSINYAKRIQQSLLANEEVLNKYIPNHFVFFKPKDIVSGDFYWAAKEDDKFYLAICDSTGHGVPGAFMSLLNIGFLSEAIKEKRITSPDKVFDYTRARLIESISKDGQRDGFDGILVCFDFKNKKITYAAANNAPMLLNNSGELVQLSTDKMPVGMGERKQDFSLFTIDYVPDSILYFYTDGYADQFGGPKGKKFMYKKLNELLFINTGKSLENQKQVLTDTFEGWRGNLEQVDDVLIIGIRL